MSSVVVFQLTEDNLRLEACVQELEAEVARLTAENAGLRESKGVAEYHAELQALRTERAELAQ